MSNVSDPQEPTRPAGLSKSKLTTFEQCAKKLWLSVHRRDLVQIDPGSSLRFQIGHEVGAIACALHPGGVMVQAEPDLAAAVQITKALIEGGWPAAIFEATFVHDGVLVRVDILCPDGAGGWTIAEVKSSTGVKDYHLGDLATQVWVASGAGVPISSAVIRHIDNRFLLERQGDYQRLFTDTPVDASIAALVENRADVVARARATLAGTEPELATGDHCSRPFACEFTSYCHRDAPPGPAWPIDLLPNTGRKMAKAWAEAGVHELTDLPVGVLSNPLHQRVLKATVTGEPFHDRDNARRATEGWAYPRAYLDFETIAFAAPRWVGARPYQNVPFQFSCHVEQADGALSHTGFLSLDGSDPRRACAEALVACCGSHDAGAVIAYNASFERRCIQDLAEACPDWAEALLDIADRLVDLLPVTRACYYDRRQRGSWSIKAVLPTIAPELDYAMLEVGDGLAAQIAWLEAVDPSTAAERRGAIAAALETYCSRDTQAMVLLLRRLVGETH